MNREWKNKNEEYLFELQKMLDTIANVKDDDLRDRIIKQCLKCDNILTELSEDMFYLYYLKGKKDGLEKNLPLDIKE